MFKRLLSFIFVCGAMTAMAQTVEFKADINEMSPMSYRPRSGLSGFSFEMRNDSAFVHLPYIGEVYSPTYGNDGLNFDEPCSGITVKPTKKNDGQIIAFVLRHDIVTYKFSITLWDDKHLDIFMQPSNAQCCSYMGEWERNNDTPQKK